MIIYRDAHVLQAFAVGFRTGLPVEVGDDHAVDAEVPCQEFVAKPEDVHVVGYAQVAAYFILFYIQCTDYDDDFRVILHLHEHFQFAVGFESRKDAARMEVVEKLAAEFQIKFVAESGYAFLDLFRLDFEIFPVVEPVFHDDRKIKYG